ncbi:MAG: glycosyltransferase family 2 protein [Acidimicrobiales bacterium]
MGRHTATACSSIDLVTVNYRSENSIRRLHASLAGVAEQRPGSRLIVVDCSGTASDLAKGGSFPIVVVDPGRNVGFAAGSNAGFAASRTDVVTFVNPDVVVDADQLLRLIDEGASSEAVAWTGQLRNADGSLQSNTARRPSFWRQAVEDLTGADTRLDRTRCGPST